MSLQYITDSKGNATGVFIPISEWNEIREKIEGFLQVDEAIPEWHKEIVRKRIELYREDTSVALDADNALDDIEKDL